MRSFSSASIFSNVRWQINLNLFRKRLQFNRYNKRHVCRKSIELLRILYIRTNLMSQKLQGTERWVTLSEMNSIQFKNLVLTQFLLQYDGASTNIPTLSSNAAKFENV